MRRNNLLLILLIEIILGGLIFASIVAFKNGFFQFRSVGKNQAVVSPKPQVPSEKKPDIVVDKNALSFLNLNNFSLDDPSVDAQVVAYKLPLKISDIYNWKQFNSKIKIPKQQSGEILQYGFSQLPYLNTPTSPQPSDFADYYAWIEKKGIPPFITSDSIVYYYNVFLAKSRQALAENVIYNNLWEFAQNMYLQSLRQYAEFQGDTKEAARRNGVYFSVALRLLSDETHTIPDIPEYLKEDFNLELENFSLTKQSSRKKSKIFFYDLDYSEFTHSTSSVKIQRFENAISWLGLPVFLSDGNKDIAQGQSECLNSESGIISTQDAKIQNLQAWLISANLSKNIQDLESWKKIYSFNSFFGQGKSEITPLHYIAALNKIYGQNIDIGKFNDDFEKIKSLCDGLPYEGFKSGIGSCKGSSLLAKNERGMRIFGYFQPWEDSIFLKLTWPDGGNLSLQGSGVKPKTAWPDGNGQFARGISSMFDLSASFGSTASYTKIKSLGDANYQNFDTALAKVALENQQRDKLAYFSDIAQTNIYAEMSLLADKPNGYPSYQSNDLWTDKQLQTFLYSWAQTRFSPYIFTWGVASSSPVLSKSNTPAMLGLEAQPILYHRLSLVASVINSALKQNFSEKELTDAGVNLEFDEMVGILQKLSSLSRDQLIGKKLNQEEASFLGGLIKRMDYLARSNTNARFLNVSFSDSFSLRGREGKSLIDCGKIKPIVVIFSHPDGYLLMGLGGSLGCQENIK